MIALTASIAPAASPDDGAWSANAQLTDIAEHTVSGLGAGQGIRYRNGHWYAYGDLYDHEPRVGIIRELGRDFRPTGRDILLMRAGEPIATHPTGLDWDADGMAILGDTVSGRGVMFRFDWQQALKDGSLDNAIGGRAVDDLAKNGCRPVFVTLNDRVLLATCDYGDNSPRLRLCDPERLFEAGKTSAPDVVVAQVEFSAYTQNLHWNPKRGWLVGVQNVKAGRGWRLDVVDLAKAIESGTVEAPGVRVLTATLPSHSELEGYEPMPSESSLASENPWPIGVESVFLKVHGQNNVVVGTVELMEPRPSPAGYQRHRFE
jgi:hypothetical protein